MVEPIESMPWYKSTIIISAGVSMLTKVLVVTGVVSDVAPADVEAISNALVLVLGGLGDLWVIKSRVVQKQAPTITVKKK